MAGYIGYSRSCNADSAESCDRHPLNRAAPKLAEKLGWTLTKARAFLKHVGTYEWHHTSSWYNRTPFYDVSDDWIEDHREKIDSFEAPASPRREKRILFKCWNMDRDIRQWDWKLTNRDGANCHDVKEVLRLVKAQRTAIKKSMKGVTHKVKVRIAEENLAAIETIVAKIKEAESTAD